MVAQPLSGSFSDGSVLNERSRIGGPRLGGHLAKPP